MAPHARLDPARYELLSTYLVRLAHFHGLSPHRFVMRVLPNLEIWTRDIDTSLGRDALVILADRLELSDSVVRSMTMYGFMGYESPIDTDWQYFRRWVNSVGVHHRMRRRFGLQYCPLCLKSASVFRVQWRLAFTFACPVHGLNLQDCCPSCCVPVIPHRSKVDAMKCWKCGASLFSVMPGSHDLSVDALVLQSQLMAYASDEQIAIGAQTMPRAQFMHGAVSILRMMKEHMHSHPSLWPFSISTKEIREELRRLRTAMRLTLFSILIELLEDWPANFLQFSLAAGITQIAFARHGQAPEWLSVAINQLPMRLRSRSTSNDAVLVRLIRRLEHEAGTKCRAPRAKVLIQAARGIYGS